MPSHWLELRWAEGQWRWQALAGAARTRGVAHARRGRLAQPADDHEGPSPEGPSQAWRVHPAETPEPTARVGIDLARPGASVDIAADGLRVTVHQGEADISIAGEHVRVLTVYAMARRDDDEGGWLGADAAWERWRSLGGNPQSPVDRLGWDRGRCRAHLARLGVGNLDLLFETRRMQGTPQVRLGLRVE